MTRNLILGIILLNLANIRLLMEDKELLTFNEGLIALAIIGIASIRLNK